MVTAPVPETSEWAMLDDAAHSWYIKPDGPQLLCSPADETPSEQCEAKPLEEDIALAIERINAATTVNIRSVNSSWAGLRTFTTDRSMVIGPDPDEPSFIWCVGQGGTGIQTSPAAGQLTAELAINGKPSESLSCTSKFRGSSAQLFAKTPVAPKSSPCSSAFAIEPTDF